MLTIPLGPEQHELLRRLLELLELHEYITHVGGGTYLSASRGGPLVGDGRTPARRMDRCREDQGALQEVLVDFIERRAFTRGDIDAIEQVDARLVAVPAGLPPTEGELLLPGGEGGCRCLSYQLDAEDHCLGYTLEPEINV